MKLLVILILSFAACHVQAYELEKVAQQKLNARLIGALQGKTVDRDFLKNKILPTVEFAEDRADYVAALNTLTELAKFDVVADGASLQVYQSGRWVASLSILNYAPLTLSKSGQVFIIDPRKSLHDQLEGAPHQTVYNVTKPFLLGTAQAAEGSSQGSLDATSLALISKLYFQNGRYLIAPEHLTDFAETFLKGDLFSELTPEQHGTGKKSEVKTLYEKFSATCSGNTLHGSMSFSAHYLSGTSSRPEALNKLVGSFSRSKFSDTVTFENNGDLTTVSTQKGQSLVLKLAEHPLSEGMNCAAAKGENVGKSLKTALCLQTGVTVSPTGSAGEAKPVPGLWAESCDANSDSMSAAERFCKQLPIMVLISKEGKRLCNPSTATKSSAEESCNAFVKLAQNIQVSTIESLEICSGKVCSKRTPNELAAEVSKKLFPDQTQKQATMSFNATLKVLEIAKSMSALKSCCGDPACAEFVKAGSRKKVSLTPNSHGIR